MKLAIPDCCLLVIDVQSRLLPVMHEPQTLLENLIKAVKGFQLLEIPLLLTEQYPKGLGPTVPELYTLLSSLKPIEKNSFSCCNEEKFLTELHRLSRQQIVVCGIEAHICVYQTCLDLKNRGYEVFLLTDAIASRKRSDRELTLRILEKEGINLTGIEMTFFTLLETCRHPRFKEIAAIIK